MRPETLARALLIVLQHQRTPKGGTRDENQDEDAGRRMGPRVTAPLDDNQTSNKQEGRSDGTDDNETGLAMNESAAP